MSSSNKPNVIVYGYSASPFYQKLLSLLAHYKVTFDICSTPPILPRPMLADELGITYRRIPILAIDGQLYFDTSLMVEVLEEHFADKSGHGHGLLTHQPELQKQLVAHWIDRDVFPLAAGLIPRAFFTKEFAKDRAGFSSAFAGGKPRLDLNKAQLMAHLASLETALNGNKWLLATSEPTYADIAAAFPLNWLQLSLKTLPEFLPAPKDDRSSAVFPNVLTWLDAVRAHVDACRAALPKPQRIDAATAAKRILADGKEAVERITSQGIVSAADPSSLAKGALVSVTPRDSGRVPQNGTLQSISATRIVIRVDGPAGPLLTHFPRATFDIESAAAEKSKL